MYRRSPDQRIHLQVVVQQQLRRLWETRLKLSELVIHLGEDYRSTVHAVDNPHKLKRRLVTTGSRPFCGVLQTAA